MTSARNSSGEVSDGVVLPSDAPEVGHFSQKSEEFRSFSEKNGAPKDVKMKPLKTVNTR
jgi:hypothetical protein